MKKILLFIFTVAFGLSSCTVDEPLDEHYYDADAIGFGSYVGKPTTKAVIANIDSLKSSGFTVNAYTTGADNWSDRIAAGMFMDDTDINWASSGWDYTPIVYWPNQVAANTYGKVTFFAYSNTDDIGAYDASNILADNPSFDFTCADVNVDQVDLLGDMLVDRTRTDGDVNFEFDHLLSKIGFSAQLAAQYDGVDIQVNSLRVIYAAGAIDKKAIYTYANDLGQNEAARGTWTPMSPAISMPSNTGLGAGDQTMNLPTATEIANALPTILDPNVPFPIALRNEALLEKSQLNGLDKFLLLIPQVVMANEFSVEISYTTIPTAGSGGTPTTSTKIIPLPNVEWMIGKQYVYNFKISLSEIIFDKITIDDWAEGGMDIVLTPSQLETRVDVSNSYIVNPDGEKIVKLQFPAVSRVNQFWNSAAGGTDAAAAVQGTTYPYAFTGHENAIGDADKWFAEVIWADFDYTDQISFKQNRDTVGMGTEFLEIRFDKVHQQGNVIIGLRKATTVVGTEATAFTDYLWSWHIWLSDVRVSADATYGANQTFTTPSGRTALDRNLGARTQRPSGVENFGLLYQWGRKDAFPGSASATVATGEEPTIYMGAADAVVSGTHGTDGFGVKAINTQGSMVQSIANPMNHYTCSGDWVTEATAGSGAPDRWNVVAGADPTVAAEYAVYGAKSIYDPCPNGWRLPWGQDWGGFTLDNFEWTENNIKGREYIDAEGKVGFFPATGRREAYTSNLVISGPFTTHYWSSSPYFKKNYAHNLQISNSNVYHGSANYYAYGLSVRPVRDIAPVENIINQEVTANSYIVAPSSDVTKLRFPAVTRANEFWKSGKPSTTYPYGSQSHPENAIEGDDKWYAEIIWADFNYDGKVAITQNSAASAGTGIDDKLEVTFTNCSAAGNVVIGLKKVGVEDYLWSWHIWISDVERTGGTFNIPGSNLTNAKTVMDRNLGARSARVMGANTDTFGLMYQWGRKDAFPGAGATSGTTEPTIYAKDAAGDVVGALYGAGVDGSHGTKAANTTTSIAGSIAAPLTYNGASGDWVSVGGAGAVKMDRWNYREGKDGTVLADYAYKGEKSIFDPCPPGWRIPWGVNWAGLHSGDSDITPSNFKWSTVSGINGRTYTPAPANTGFFPAGGYRYGGNGNISEPNGTGYAWSASPYSATSGRYLHFSASSVAPSNGHFRTLGYAVRPVKDDGFVEPPQPDAVVTTYADDKVANSYIVAGVDAPKTLIFPAVQRSNQFWNTGGTGANTTTPANEYPYGYSGHENKITADTDKWIAELIWADMPIKDKITFKQNANALGVGIVPLEVTLDRSITEGNIVVGIRKQTAAPGEFTDYLWSWHIWVTDVRADANQAAAAGQTFNVAARAGSPAVVAKTVMDRNLGARSARVTGANTDTFGLMYQWGRKDAFVGSASHNRDVETRIYTNNMPGSPGEEIPRTGGQSTITNSIANPLHFYAGGGEWVEGTGVAGAERNDRWNVITAGYDADVTVYDAKGDKSIFDPCPPGWRVPWGRDWSGFTSSNFTEVTQQGVYGRQFTGNGANAWFPATGRRHPDSGALELVSTYGFSWSGAPQSATSVYYLTFSASGVHPSDNWSRSYGFPVRPVYDGAVIGPVAPVDPPEKVGVQTETKIANSYIVPVGGKDTGEKTTTLQFPAITRVNEFWKTGNIDGVAADAQKLTYPYGFKDHANAIGANDEWYAEVIWADFDWVGHVTCTQNKRAKGSGIATNLEVILKNTPAKGGNVIVGLKKDGVDDYLWSWHIWISDVKTTDTFDVVARGANVVGAGSVHAVEAKKVMDRNLGALAGGRPIENNTDTFGLFYQWGRKDAFPGAGAFNENVESKIWNTTGDGASYGENSAFGSKVEVATSIVGSIAAPLTYNGTFGEWVSAGAGSGVGDRWGSDAAGAKGAKSIYDPCPPGWRMPWGKDWTGFPAAANSAPNVPEEFQWTTIGLMNGRIFTDNGATVNNGWFPASGLRNPTTGALTYVSTYGYGWSGASNTTTHGYFLGFYASGVYPSSSNLRSYGLTVRPVIDPDDTTP